LPTPIVIGCLAFTEAPDRNTSPSVTVSRSALGISTPIALLPGIGERMRTSFDATEYARFFERAVTRSTFTPGPSSISYCVTVGPRENPVTFASTWNWSSTAVIWRTTSSFAAERAFAGAPAASVDAAGRW
jgi:hypothetical protein